MGTGKLGSSIARLPHVKGVRVIVHDVDPVRRAQAMAQGFEVARDRDQLGRRVGVERAPLGLHPRQCRRARDLLQHSGALLPSAQRG
ncbi:hypothetical protein [Streptomyces sp. AC1-42T]|uniref:hypothetical protein n=1 Tax=Streptomyces sp. AC1-42T TaxID=2218665 RepID=UPI00406C8FB7